MITLQHFPKIRAPEIFRQIHSIKVPPPGIYRGKVPVQKCKTVHIAWLLPPIGRSLLLGLVGTEDMVLGAQGLALPEARIEVQDRPCLRGKVRITRKDPVLVRHGLMASVSRI